MKMKRLLVIFTCCFPLVLSPAVSFALDSTISTAQEKPFYKKYGPIRYYESLWSVSKKLRPNSSVSIQQTLVAIYKLNPDVFFAGDINHLLENSVINVPTDSFIKKQTNQDAISLINQYSDKRKTATKTVAALKSENDPITESHSLSEQKAVAVEEINSPDMAVADTEDQSLTASLIDKKYLPDPKNQADNSSVSPDPAIESGNEPQHQSTDNVKNTVSADAGSQSLTKILALQSELNLVNEQLAATAKVNQEFKSKLQLLIDEIDLLKYKIEGESADQLRLLTLLEEYKPEPNSSQQPVIDSAGVNKSKESWITGSFTNLLLVAGGALLLITFIFSLIFRRRTEPLLDEKPSNRLNNVLISQDERIATLQVDHSIGLTSETSFDKGPDEVDKRPAVDENDELTAVHSLDINFSAAEKAQASRPDLSENRAVIEIFDEDQAIDAVSLNASDQLQNSVAQAKLNQESSDLPIEKEQFTAIINRKKSENYIDIDTLLKNTAGDNQDDLYTEFDLDLGLDEFPDMLGENTAIDIDDDQYGISAHLDLARAYLEIGDKIRAKKILMASIENSDPEQRQEIDKLLSLL